MHRLLPPLLLLLCLAGALILHYLWPAPTWIAPPYTWVGLALLVPGIALPVVASRGFARSGTNINTFLPPDVLVIDGPFRLTRNPMYLGFLLILTGTSIVLGSVSALAAPIVFFAVANAWYIPFEERACATRFGAAYADYQARTRRWI